MNHHVVILITKVGLTVGTAVILSNENVINKEGNFRANCGKAVVVELNNQPANHNK
jgi:hypothetical protein